MARTGRKAKSQGSTGAPASARMWTRRGFLLFGTLGVAALAGCSDFGQGEAGGAVSSSGNAAAAGSEGSAASESATEDVQNAIGSDAWSRPDPSAAARTAEKEGDIVSNKEVRELVQMDLPSWQGVDFAHVIPDPANSEGTVASARVDAARSQQLFLWEEGNVPADRGSRGGAGHDPADFRPTVTSVPVPTGMPVKGAVLLCAGGAFEIRGDNSDCYPTANALAGLGYQCFVVDYRVYPYGQEVAGLDLARAIRFVRSHWRDFGLPSERHIAIGGFSAGGILCGEAVLNRGGTYSPQELDSGYEPDELDSVDADVSAVAMIYSFYGRLAWAEKSAQVLQDGQVPPTYYCYGTQDPFYDQFEGQVNLMQKIGRTVRARVLEGWPHGFGAEGGWAPEFDDFMQEAFA